MYINGLDCEDYAISADEYAELTSGDLVEICELHSHGYLVEIISVHVATQYTDSGEFHGIVIAAGDIQGNFEPRDTYNVTCIGGGFERVGTQRYYAIEYGDNETDTRNQAIKLGAYLIGTAPTTPISV